MTQMGTGGASSGYSTDTITVTVASGTGTAKSVALSGKINLIKITPPSETRYKFEMIDDTNSYDTIKSRTRTGTVLWVAGVSVFGIQTINITNAVTNGDYTVWVTYR